MFVYRIQVQKDILVSHKNCSDMKLLGNSSSWRGIIPAFALDSSSNVL